MKTVGFLLIFAGFVLATSTVRVRAFRSSAREGIFTFVIPLYCWWYGFAKLRWTKLMSAVLACYLLGGVLFLAGGVSTAARKAKSAEASLMVNKMWKSAVEGWENPIMDWTGMVFPRAFPRPSGPPITDDGGGKVWVITSHSKGVPQGKKEIPDVKWTDQGMRGLWNDWLDPTYFRYTYRTGGEGQGAWFEVIAEGDLNGDGKASKYVRRGEVRGGYVEGGPLRVTSEP